MIQGASGGRRPPGARKRAVARGGGAALRIPVGRNTSPGVPQPLRYDRRPDSPEHGAAPAAGPVITLCPGPRRARPVPVREDLAGAVTAIADSRPVPDRPARASSLRRRHVPARTSSSADRRMRAHRVANCQRLRNTLGNHAAERSSAVPDSPCQHLRRSLKFVLVYLGPLLGQPAPNLNCLLVMPLGHPVRGVDLECRRESWN